MSFPNKGSTSTNVRTCQVSTEGDVSFLEMDVEAKQFLVASLVMPKVVDARTLLTCSAVSRGWRELALNERLWENLCVRKWPSLKSSVGKKMLEGRGYRSYLVTRIRLDYGRRVFKLRAPRPTLQLDELVFTVDVLYRNINIFSIVKGAQEIATESWASGLDERNMFRFTTAFSEDFEGMVVLRSPETRWWRRSQMMAFDVTWSVVHKGSLKSIKFVQNTKARLVGNSIIVETSLPKLSCLSNLPIICVTAEVDIQCKEEGSGYFIPHHLTLGTLIPEWCRYQTIDQVLTYLENLFYREYLAPIKTRKNYQSFPFPLPY